MSEDLRGVCWKCPYYIGYADFCDYYKVEVVQGFLGNCNNKERIINGKD